MTLKEFRDDLLKKGKQLEDLTRRRMPVFVGQMAKSHYQENFRKSGFVNNGLNDWKPSKRLSNPGKSATSNYKTLTSGRNHLFSSIKYIPGDAQVTIRNDVEYAQIHNEGGTFNVAPTVTKKMKKFAWAQYYNALGLKKGEKAPKFIPEDAERWRRLALTKKQKLNIKIDMPQRQFIGESKELNDKIAAKWEQKIEEILNS